jgi:transcriptional regulator with XRE-family HTH domain
MDIQKTIVANIRKWRKKSGLSQEKLAALCNTAPAYIRQIEIGHRGPSLKYLERIAAALNIAPWQLLYEDSAQKDETPFEDFSAKKKEIKKELLTNLSKSISENIKTAFEKLER